MSVNFKLCSVCRRQVSNSHDKECDACILEDHEDESSPHFNAYMDDVKYILPNDYNDMIDNVCKENNNILSVVHFNCRSIKKNFDNFCSVIASISCPFSCIAMSETWLSDSESIQVPGYNFFGKGRANKRGGGVGCLVKDGIKCRQRTDLDIFNPHIETVFIEIYSKVDNIVLAIVYRPPGQNVNEFLSSLEIPLSAISRENKQCLVIGDFNIDLLASSSQHVNSFTDLLMSFSCTPLILNPTRITQDSATLIDNIFTNNTDNILRTGILLNDVSDHFSVFTILNHSICNFSKPKSYKRFIDDEKICKFQHLLRSTEWNDMYTINDVEDRYDFFLNKLTELYDKCFPLKEVLPKKFTVNPWFTNDLKKMCKQKNILYRKYIKNPTDYRKLVYKQYRNKVSSKIRQSKQQYYRDRFSKYRDNIKGTWRVINDLLNKTRDKVQCYTLKHNDENITEPQDIVNTFNNYFRSIGADVIHKIPQTSSTFRDFLPPRKCPNSFFLRPIEPNEIIKTVKKFQNNKSPGYDEIDSSVLKQSVHLLAIPLCSIFNLSFEQGVFPSSLKVAKVIPIHKKGNTSISSNYRPISILSVFSKLFEKLVHRRLVSYLCRKRILYAKQFGFRPGYSTYMALLDFCDRIANAFENKEFVVGIFLDLSKAFDCISHDILLEKLNYYGVRGITLEWFKSYLQNRKQYVHANGYSSPTQEINVGVPQGSV